MFALALGCLPLSCIGAFRLTPIISGGLSSPIFAGNANDGSNRLFIVEQGGVVKVLQPGSSTPTVFLDIRSRTAADGERGLLELAFHPNYQSTRRFFVYYTRPSDGAIVIAEYRVSSDPNVAGTAETVLLIDGDREVVGKHNEPSRRQESHAIAAPINWTTAREENRPATAHVDHNANLTYPGKGLYRIIGW